VRCRTHGPARCPPASGSLSRGVSPHAHGSSAMRTDLASRLIAWAMGVPMLLLAVWALLDLVSGTR